jgi:peptidoglycan hydrolase CwlO-like protein
MWNFIEKSIDKIAIAILAMVTVAMCMVMLHTVESNMTTADIAVIQSKYKKQTLQEVALLTAEVRMLQNNIEKLENKIVSQKETLTVILSEVQDDVEYREFR